MTRFVPNEFELPTEPARKSQLVSAADVIDNKMPPELLELGQRIKVHLKKVGNHYSTVGWCLGKAEKLCDDGGFEEFQDKFCPELGRSRTYELIAIAKGKKSLEDHRATNAKRNREYRKKKKAAELAAAAAAFAAAANPGAGSPSRDGRPAPTPAVADAISTLVKCLGYPRAEARAAIAAAARTAGDWADAETLITLALKAAGRVWKPTTESAETSTDPTHVALDIPADENRIGTSPVKYTPEERLRAVTNALDHLHTVFEGDTDAMYAAINDYLRRLAPVSFPLLGKPKVKAA